MRNKTLKKNRSKKRGGGSVSIITYNSKYLIIKYNSNSINFYCKMGNINEINEDKRLISNIRMKNAQEYMNMSSEILNNTRNDSNIITEISNATSNTIYLSDRSSRYYLKYNDISNYLSLYEIIRSRQNVNVNDLYFNFGRLLMGSYYLKQSELIIDFNIFNIFYSDTDHKILSLFQPIYPRKPIEYYYHPLLIFIRDTKLFSELLKIGSNQSNDFFQRQQLQPEQFIQGIVNSLLGENNGRNNTNLSFESSRKDNNISFVSYRELFLNLGKQRSDEQKTILTNCLQSAINLIQLIKQKSRNDREIFDEFKKIIVERHHLLGLGVALIMLRERGVQIQPEIVAEMCDLNVSIKDKNNVIKQPKTTEEVFVMYSKFLESRDPNVAKNNTWYTQFKQDLMTKGYDFTNNVNKYLNNNFFGNLSLFGQNNLFGDIRQKTNNYFPELQAYYIELEKLKEMQKTLDIEKIELFKEKTLLGYETTKLEGIKNEIIELYNKINGSQSETNTFKELNTKLQEENTTLQNKIKELESDKQKCNEENNSYNEQIKECKKTEEELTNLKAEKVGKMSYIKKMLFTKKNGGK